MANTAKKSAFNEFGFKETVELLLKEIQQLYTEDGIPWVIGYSGGKDSTAVLSLVWLALARLDPAQLTKDVHVISTDTLVENPIVAGWVSNSLEQMKDFAIKAGLPIIPHRLTPEVKDTFWVNLIGRGYPSPRPKFRWCTERLKIKPSNKFIKDMVRANGEAILVLGTRKAESTSRAARMVKMEEGRVRDRLSPNGSLPNSLVFSPVEDWTNDDVWLFLMQVANPWEFDNRNLLAMYKGASADNECPLVVDTTTPSCGDSRFGCWVCTMVEEDKSMQAMIQNDQEKAWMTPLLKLRNELDVPNDREIRDFRRMSGRVQLFGTSVVPGPYTQQARADWLRKLLRAQIESRSNAPEDLKNIELITLEELREIRRTWVIDKHEIEDLLPRIYLEETGFEFPDDTNYFVINRQSEEILKEVCGDDFLHYEMVRNLMATSRTLARQAKRRNLMKSLEDEIKRSYYEGKEDALELARTKATMLGQPADWIVEDLETYADTESVVQVSLNARGANQ